MIRPLNTLIFFCTLLAAVGSTGAAVKDVPADAARAASRAFFEENAKKEDVVSLPSGLQYRVLNSGTGRKPKATDAVMLHYRGTTLAGQEIDSSYEGTGPVELPVNKTMPGWRQALLLMQEGAKWELFIPPGLGYTKQRGTPYSRRGELTSQALIFQLELLEVRERQLTPIAKLASRGVQRRQQNAPHVFVYLMGNGEPDSADRHSGDDVVLELTDESLAVPQLADAVEQGTAAATAPENGVTQETAQATPPETAPEAADASEGDAEQDVGAIQKPAPAKSTAQGFDQDTARGAVISLPDGVKYRVIRDGTGRAPRVSDTVTVHYRGRLLDGTEFDSSYRSGAPATFALDEAIAGWQQVLQGMHEGASWELYIPPQLGYRKPGPLAGQALIFEVELLAVTAAETVGEPTQAEARGVAPAEQLSISLPSGLSYRVIRNGGGLSPLPGDSITVEYREKRQDSGEAEGDWRNEGQATFPLNWLIPAWRTVFTRMEEGARWELQVPPELAHTAWGRRPEAPLTLQVDLLSVSAAPAEGIALAALEVAEADSRAKPATGSTAALTDLGEGMRYRVASAGSGDRVASDATVTLHYSSTLLDVQSLGHVYHGDGQVTVRLDEAMPVWQRTLGAMRQGSRWRIYLPSERVPAFWAPLAGQTALLEVELLAIEPSPVSQ